MNILVTILCVCIGVLIAMYLIHCGYTLEWVFSKLDKLFRRKT